MRTYGRRIGTRAATGVPSPPAPPAGGARCMRFRPIGDFRPPPPASARASDPLPMHAAWALVQRRPQVFCAGHWVGVREPGGECWDMALGG